MKTKLSLLPLRASFDPAGSSWRGTTFRLSLPIGPADIRNSHDFSSGSNSEIRSSA